MKKSLLIEYGILVLIFLLVVSFRLFFVIQSGYFNSDDAYLNIRYVKELIEEKKPISYDRFSYGGREVAYAPLFYYVLAFFGWFLPLNLILKVLPLLFVSSLVFIVYFIAKELAKDKKVALVVAFISGFIPVVIGETLNTISVYSLLLPLMFLMIYCLIRIKEKKFLNLFVLLSFILPLLHQDAFLFVASLFFYLLFIGSEGLKLDKLKKEAIIFCIFLIFLKEFILFKKAFLEYGWGVIWQNIPKQVLEKYFMDIGLWDIIYKVGVVPLIFGISGVVFNFKERNDGGFLIMGVITATLLFSWLKLVQPMVGLMFLGVALVIISALALSKFFIFLKKTKFEVFSKLLFFGVLLLVVFLMIIPSWIYANDIMKDIPKGEEIESLKWISGNTPRSAIILGMLSEGNLIAAVGERRNVLDSSFLLAPDPVERYDDVELLFSTKKPSEAKKILKKYNVGYIYFSEKAKEKYGIESLNYTEFDKECFEKVYEVGKVEIFKFTC